MLCEICKKQEANMHFTQACNGMVNELHVCEECAEENGFDAQSPMSLTDFLFGVGGDNAVFSGPDKSCPVCHVHWRDFKKNSRLGCSSCYKTFSEELAPVLASMQKGRKHVGKRASSQTVTAEARSLQAALEKAVATQNFEEAAKLRDRIVDLGAKGAGREKTEATKC